jgi:hypothetical protein
MFSKVKYLRWEPFKHLSKILLIIKLKISKKEQMRKL